MVNDTITYRNAQKTYLGHITSKHFDLLGNTTMIMETSLLIYMYLCPFGKINADVVTFTIKFEI